MRNNLKMRSFKTAQIKASLNNAVMQLPNISFDEIADMPFRKLEEHDFITKQDTSKSPTAFAFKTRFAAVVACCFLLFSIAGYTWYSFNIPVDSVITMNINPSFEISLNKLNIVLAIKPLNEDAKVVLEGKNFRGEKLDAATEELFLSIADNNFISNDKNNVTISVQNKDEKHLLNVENELRDHIKKALNTAHISPNIVTVAHDENPESKPKNPENKPENTKPVDFIKPIEPLETIKPLTPNDKEKQEEIKEKQEEAKKEEAEKQEEAKKEAVEKQEEAKKEAVEKQEEAKKEAVEKQEEAKKEAEKQEEAKKEAVEKQEEAKKEEAEKQEEAKKEEAEKQEEAKKEAAEKQEEAKKEAAEKQEEAKKEAAEKQEAEKQEEKQAEEQQEEAEEPEDS